MPRTSQGLGPETTESLRRGSGLEAPRARVLHDRVEHGRQRAQERAARRRRLPGRQGQIKFNNDNDDDNNNNNDKHNTTTNNNNDNNNCYYYCYHHHHHYYYAHYDYDDDYY